MGDIREITIKELGKEMADTGMESADKILLSQAYGVPTGCQCLPGIKNWQRGTPVPRTEGQKLGGNAVARLYQVREAANEPRAIFGQLQFGHSQDKHD
jgi:hypothetical protein